jgi:hypothetical protein
MELLKGDEKMNRICCNYASDEHLLLILLPYINEKLKENQNVVTILEKNIGKSLGCLKSIFNFTKEEWDNIEKLFCFKDENELDKTSKYEINSTENKKSTKQHDKINLLKEKNNIVIIIGSNEFIKEKEENLIETKIITDMVSCYSIEQLEDGKDICLKYTHILSTKGVKNIDKIFTENSNKIYKKITILK